MRKFKTAMFASGILSLLLAPALLSGQDDKSKQGGGAPPAVQQRAIMVEATDDGSGNVQIHSFSTTGGDFVMSSPLPMAGAWGGMTADPSQLIFDPQVRKNLELDDDQVKQLRDIQREFGKRMQEKMKFTHGPDADPNQYKELSKVLQQISKERKEAMGAVLLPHQSKRLDQISTQMEMRNRGDANALTGDAISKELGIDEAQKKRLREKAKEIKAEMEAEIAKIKEAGRKKLLRELSTEQRKQLEEMMGETFEYKKVDMQERLEKLRQRTRRSKKEDR